MAVLSATPIINAAVADAKSLPALISNLEKINPDLATQLETKPLIASRSPWGVAAGTLIGLAAARYGLPPMDPQTTALLSGLIVMICSTAAAYVMRLITKQPTAGIISTPPSVPPAVQAPPPAESLRVSP